MKIRCEKKDLLTAVSNVSRAAPAKSPIPALEGVLFEASKDGLKLTAYDTVSLNGGVGAYRFTHIPKGTYTLTAKWFEDTKEITLRQEIEVK